MWRWQKLEREPALGWTWAHLEMVLLPELELKPDLSCLLTPQP